CCSTASRSAGVSGPALSKMRLETPSLSMSCRSPARCRSTHVASPSPNSSARSVAKWETPAEWRTVYG
ncbi:MAG: hypothetical protein AVDCRST_MAG11-3007, partial [uncultured Gemmatimonadaceae bacterium]